MKSVRVHAQTILPKPESCGFAWEVLIKTVRVSVCWNPKIEIAQGALKALIAMRRWLASVRRMYSSTVPKSYLILLDVSE